MEFINALTFYFIFMTILGGEWKDATKYRNH